MSARSIGLVLVGVMAVSSAALAQDGAKAGAKPAAKQTEYSFEDDNIDGDLSRPDGEYIEAKRQVKHSNLIKIREEFKAKVMQSVGEL